MSQVENPSASLIIARLLSDPEPASQRLAKKLMAVVDVYECPLCKFQGEPGLVLSENPPKLLFYCPICSNKKVKPDDLKYKA